ncbi:MAG: flagellar basal body rod C-terminal domain-containing protein [Hyphomonadaceae bacterium]|nr:flagellar basal body rod C-terminal domain-containing protein [Hyphomonadaceae bacterium]
MDYGQILSISAAGMSVERLRLETAALNLANANLRSGSPTTAFKPKKVVAFAQGLYATDFAGRESVSPQAILEESTLEPKPIHDPGDPLADAGGFVYAPAVNPVEEMLTVMTAVRAYEANVRTLEASRGMLLRALEIGSGT